MTSTLLFRTTPHIVSVALTACFAASATASEGNASAAAGCPTDTAVVLAKLEPATVILPPLKQSSISQCMVDWNTVRDQNRVLIDVRSPISHSEVSVAGSLNIPSGSVQHRQFLKGQPLLLIDDGKSEVQVTQLCEELQTAGFRDVRALRGGLRVLHAVGLPVDGTPQVIEKLGKLSAQEFHTVIGRPGWRSISSDIDLLLADRLGVRVDQRLAANSRGTELADALRKVINKETDNTWVAIGFSEATRAQTLALLSPEERARVLFLTDAMEGYASFLKQQTLMLATAGKPLVRPCHQ